MKKQSTFGYVLRLALTLLLICSIMAGALAAINSVTAPIIQRLTWEKTQKAIEAVLPGGGEVIDVPAVDAGAAVSSVYKGENGYAVEVVPSGFGGGITMMVGIDFEGNVLGVSVISHTETAGLGSVAGDKTSKGEAFRGQFVGQSGQVSVTKDGGQIDAITGATITSRAVCVGINAALAVVANLG